MTDSTDCDSSILLCVLTQTHVCVDVQVVGIKCIVFLDTLVPRDADVEKIVQFFQGEEVLLGKTKLSIVHLLPWSLISILFLKV